MVAVEAFDGGHRPLADVDGEREAGAGELAVEQHGAGAADAVIAAALGAGQAEAGRAARRAASPTQARARRAARRSRSRPYAACASSLCGADGAPDQFGEHLAAVGGGGAMVAGRIASAPRACVRLRAAPRRRGRDRRHRAASGRSRRSPRAPCPPRSPPPRGWRNRRRRARASRTRRRRPAARRERGSR